MPVETATLINQFNVAWPLHSDGLGASDSHLRLIKQVLQTTFPNILNAITASDANLNILSGTTVTSGDLATIAGRAGYAPGQAVFTASGSWVVPAGVTKVKARVWAAGGGGGASYGAGSAGGGGGGAGYTEGWVSVTPGASVPVTGGAGGTGGTGSSGGGYGGTSSFGALSATGGAGGGFVSGGFGPGGGPGSGSNGTLNMNGTSGVNGYPVSSSVVVAGEGGAAFGMPPNLTVATGSSTVGSSGGFGVGGNGGLGGAGGGKGGGGLVVLDW